MSDIRATLLKKYPVPGCLEWRDGRYRIKDHLAHTSSFVQICTAYNAKLEGYADAVRDCADACSNVAGNFGDSDAIAACGQCVDAIEKLAP